MVPPTLKVLISPKLTQSRNPLEIHTGNYLPRPQSVLAIAPDWWVVGADKTGGSKQSDTVGELMRTSAGLELGEWNSSHGTLRISGKTIFIIFIIII